MTAFIIGAVLGISVLIVELIRKKISPMSWETPFALLFYGAFGGWFVAFTWKFIQWPFI